MYCTHTPEHGSPKPKRINKHILCTLRWGQYTPPPAGLRETSFSYKGLDLIYQICLLLLRYRPSAIAYPSFPQRSEISFHKLTETWNQNYNHKADLWEGEERSILLSTVLYCMYHLTFPEGTLKFQSAGDAKNSSRLFINLDRNYPILIYFTTASLEWNTK